MRPCLRLPGLEQREAVLRHFAQVVDDGHSREVSADEDARTATLLATPGLHATYATRGAKRGMPLPTLFEKVEMTVDTLFTDALFTAYFIDRTWLQPRVRSQTLR